MKYEVGDEIIVLHSNEEGRVVEIMNDKMVMIEVRGVKFPAYMDQIDFPYFLRFTRKKLVEENAGIRTHEGGKKLASRNEDHYDAQLLSFCSQQFQKASKVVKQALTKYGLPTGDVHLGWRLKMMAEQGKLMLQGDLFKSNTDFEVRIPGEVVQSASAENAEPA